MFFLCLQFILHASFDSNSMKQYFEVVESFLSEFTCVFSVVPLKTQIPTVQSNSTEYGRRVTTKQLPALQRRPG